MGAVFKYIYRIQIMIYVFLLFSVFIPSEGTYLYPKQNHLARVIHKWGPSFLVQFDLKVLSFHGYGTNRHRSILRFSDNTYDDYHVDGSRIPALFTRNDGKILHRMSIPGTPNYAYSESVNIHRWYSIQYLQFCRGHQWIFQVRRDGHIVNEVLLKGRPRTYGYVRLYISDKFYGPGLAVIKNLVYRNTDYTGRALNQSTANFPEMKYGEDEIEYEDEINNEEDEMNTEEDEMSNEEDEMNNKEDEMNNEENEMNNEEDIMSNEDEMNNEEDELNNEEDEMSNEEDEMSGKDEMNNEEDERKDDHYSSDTEYADEEM